jgi:two-component system CheB/CheR fusion protein
VRVKERTADLSSANQTLEAEIFKRRLAEEEGKELLWRLSEAQETERGRISRELHDQLGQELTALKLGLRLLKNQVPDAGPAGESLVKLERLAGGLMQEIHRLAWELHPASLDDLGLEAALRRYTAEWSQRTGLPLDFHCDGMERERLPLALETALYRIAQEALNNVQKHANARKVGVMLDRRAGRVSLVVEDDGAGFEVSGGLPKSGAAGKLGLLGMRERVAHAGGTLDIESKPGAGTTLFVRVPFPSREGEERP